ncbi:MAG: quinolinate synthase NadA [Planctomycetota bacterium]
MSTRRFTRSFTEVASTEIQLQPGVDICQVDYPLDRYQVELKPYAEEYLALPNRTPEVVLPWMESYLEPALAELSDRLLILAHYYMGGEIVKLVERFGGQVADSYQLALMARDNPEKKIIVESAVHFMAETIAVLADPSQRVFITNPKAGCTMEMFAKEEMVEPALIALEERYGEGSILPVCYMNTSGRIKALTGERGGAVCTSSNVEAIFQWALDQGKRIFFVPDRHMGENVAAAVGIAPDRIAHWPGGAKSLTFSIDGAPESTRDEFDRSQLILFGSYCGVHTFFEPWMVDHWHQQGYTVLAHPECPKVVVDQVDGSGSTAYLWQRVLRDEWSTGRYAVGTEGHFVENLAAAAEPKGIAVVNLGEAPRPDGTPSKQGCGCATMSRNDPPHLVGVIDLIRKGHAPEYNEVRPGDVVDEFTGRRERLDDDGQEWVASQARAALERMIEITDRSS